MSQITIRMPKDTLAKWLAALRSGDYRQGRRALYDASTDGYCCLGVLQHVMGGNVERYEDWTPKSYPSETWRNRLGVEFRSSRGGTTHNPHLPKLETDAASANDTGHSFAEIADAIEACAEGT